MLVLVLHYFWYTFTVFLCNVIQKQNSFNLYATSVVEEGLNLSLDEVVNFQIPATKVKRDPAARSANRAMTLKADPLLAASAEHAVVVLVDPAVLECPPGRGVVHHRHLAQSTGSNPRINA